MLCVLAFVGCGCAGHPSIGNDPFGTVSPGSPQPGGVPDKPNALIVEPAPSSRGKIILVNTSARYVVLSCPFGYIPALDRRLTVYRGNLKVAEIKITGPQRDTNTVGDIIAGECQVGDETREE